MNIDNLESRHLKQEKNCNQPLLKKDIQPAAEDVVENPAEPKETHETGGRSSSDWVLLIRLGCSLSACIGLILGLILGFVGGRLTASTAEEPTTEVSIYDQYDYTRFVINSDGTTIDDVYKTSEEKFHAMNIIGTQVPTLSYIDQNEETFTTEALNEGSYIIELMEPTCAYCKKMVDVVSEYTAIEGSVPVIGLSLAEGSLKSFNTEDTETYFHLIQKDDKTKAFVDDHVVWIPTFVFVSNGTVKLVAYGSKTVDDFVEMTRLAFDLDLNPDKDSDKTKEE